MKHVYGEHVEGDEDTPSGRRTRSPTSSDCDWPTRTLNRTTTTPTPSSPLSDGGLRPLCYVQ